jgi:hypothetical protein
MNVADLEIGERDSCDDPILTRYAFDPPRYCVYRTSQRVLVHFADDGVKADDGSPLARVQRRALAPLNPLRGEINGLIDGWRSPAGPDRFGRHAALQRKAERYDRRVGDALVVALEDDAPSAQILLTSIKQDLLDERISWGRFEYLLTALLAMFAMAALAGLVFIGASVVAGARGLKLESQGVDMVCAAASGLVGAFFSISVGISGRTVLPDLRRLSNTLDASLRMLIGMIGAVVLAALVDDGAVTLALGNAHLAGNSGSPQQPPEWLYILIIGFVAGFSERFVPDLLAKVVATAPAPAAAPRAPPLPPPPPSGGAPAAAAQAGQAPPAATADPVPEQAADDDCASGATIPDNQLTPDAQLPAAAGGVAPGA